MGDKGHDIGTYVEKLIKNDQFSEVTELLENPINLELVRENGWDMVYSVCTKLKECAYQENHLHVYEDILILLAKRSNPKEVLLSLLEEADCSKKKEFFSIFLKPLKIALLRTPGKRGKTFEEVLDLLQEHTLTWLLPEDHNLEGDERLLLDIDSAVQATSFVLPKYLDFFKPFVDEVSVTKMKGENVCYIDRAKRQINLLEIFLLKLFHYPLLYHDLHYYPNRAKSTIRICCENIIHYISCMCSNVLTLYNLLTTEECNVSLQGYDYSDKITLESVQKTSEDTKKNSVSPLAVANFSYVVFAEQLASDSRPFVYSSKFLFKKHLYFIILLLSTKKHLVIYKGLSLSNFFLRCIKEFELSPKYLELKNFKLFPKVLTSIAIHCPVEEYRRLSMELFHAYIDKYDYEGRYRLLLLLISSVKHSGVQSCVITAYKNYLHSCIIEENNSANCFYGRYMKSFFRYALKLPDDVETDLLQCSDKILSALNLLRYLVLRDSSAENVTGIWSIINEVKETFLMPLQKGLVLSKAHYKLQMQLFKEEKVTEFSDVTRVVTMTNQVLPNLPANQHLQVIQTALLTFDMIESVLMRLNEIL